MQAYANVAANSMRSLRFIQISRGNMFDDMIALTRISLSGLMNKLTRPKLVVAPVVRGVFNAGACAAGLKRGARVLGRESTNRRCVSEHGLGRKRS